MHSKIKKYDPAVDKRFLILFSGILWSVVGIMLCRLAVYWLSQASRQNAIWPGLAGFILAFLIYRFGFLKLVSKNTDRILSKEGKVCIFAFQTWKSYLIVVVMILLGIILRHSPIPKPYLAIIYIGFGGAMILSSLVYYLHFFKNLK
ncbi:MAG: hypothetical protein HZB30_13300 [Nitrospirae bacterium]|nr:hypothetical protein [Nitrospirota bacterium]